MDTRMRLTRRLNTEYSANLAKRRTWYADPTPTPDPVLPPTLPPAKPNEGLPQDEVNKLVGQARIEGRDKAMADLLKELGFEKPEDLKKTVKAKQDADLAAMDEKTRLEKERDDAKLEAEAAKADHAALKAERQIEKRDNGIVKAFQAAKANNPDDLLILMTAKKPALVKAVMNDDGTINEKALGDLITAAKQEYKASFVGPGPGSPSNSAGKTIGDKPDFGKTPLVRF